MEKSDNYIFFSEIETKKERSRTVMVEQTANVFNHYFYVLGKTIFFDDCFDLIFSFIVVFYKVNERKTKEIKFETGI